MRSGTCVPRTQRRHQERTLAIYPAAPALPSWLRLGRGGGLRGLELSLCHAPGISTGRCGLVLLSVFKEMMG